jgi:adenosylhomocysteine nucleosidase
LLVGNVGVVRHVGRRTAKESFVSRIAVIAALQREIAPLVSGSGWQRLGAELPPTYAGGGARVVCAGVGPGAARRAAEAMIRSFRPTALVSAGLAGALVPEYSHPGRVMFPVAVIDCETGRRFPVRLPAVAGQLSGVGCRRSADPGRQPRADNRFPDSLSGVLVSVSAISDAGSKPELARRFQADAVDMEAASVAEVAQEAGLPFLAVKAICDEHDFAMPSLQAYVTEEGKFLAGRWLLQNAWKPRMLPVLSGLAWRSHKASRALCRALRALLDDHLFPMEAES